MPRRLTRRSDRAFTAHPSARTRGRPPKAASWLVALSVGLSAPLLSPGSALADLPDAPVAEPTRLEGDARLGLIHELRSINRSLRLARLNFERHSQLDREDAIEVLNSAQIAFFEEDYVKAVLKLVELTGQPGFKRHPGYGEALTYLAEALWHLGMPTASTARFREALDQRALPTAYRHTLSRYLTVAGATVPMDDLERFWARYQSLRGDAEVEAADFDIRYRYAKALYNGKRLAKAQATFEAIGADEADPYQLRGQYFVGVIHLRRGDQLKAIEAFEGAYALYQKALAASPVPELPEQLSEGALEAEAKGYKGEESLEVIAMEGAPDPEGDPSARFEQEMAALAAEEGIDEDAIDTQIRDHVGHLVTLALARLHAARDEFDASWRYYRKVLAFGSPEETAALAEASFVLSKRGAYDWSRRLVDRQLRRRSEDLSSAKLRLWRAQLMAQAANYDAAQDDYAKMEEALSERARQLATDLSADPRMFPEALLAWSAPEDAQFMRSLETDLILQRAELEGVSGLIDEIDGLTRQQGALPSVAHGRSIHEGLVAQLKTFEGRLHEAEIAARRAAEANLDTRSGLPGGRLTAAAPEAMPAFREIRRSTERLKARLDRFSSALDRYERTYRDRIKHTLAEEAPRLTALQRTLDGQTGSAKALAADLRLAAQGNLDRYVGEAQFGQVNLAWWRKWEISQRIKRAGEEAADLEAELREAVQESP